MGAVKSLLRYSAVRSKGLEYKQSNTSQQPSTAPSNTPASDAGKPTEEFLERLRVVYVESKPGTTTVQENENEPVHEASSSRKGGKLPQDRSVKLEDDFHVEKPQKGYLTTKQVMDIFNSRWAHPEEFTAHHVASEYGIPPPHAESLLKYFTNYKVHHSGPSPKPDMKFHPLHR